MPIIAWLLEKLTSKIALPILAVLLVTNIASGVSLWITRHTLADRTVELTGEKATHQADIATWKAAVAKAHADDQAHALAVQAAQDKITQEKQNDLQTKLDNARALAAAWVRSHPVKTDLGGVGNAGVPAAPNTASPVDGTPASTGIPSSDVTACAQAYVVAKGWQDWFRIEYSVVR